MAKDTKLKVYEVDLEREAIVAKRRIESFSSSLSSISETLALIHRIINANSLTKKDIEMIDVNSIIEKENAKPDKSKGHPDIAIFTKKRNVIENLTDRLWYKMFGIYFYIEFTVRYSKNDDKHLYGLFSYIMSYYIEKNNVEDKSIVSFIIDEDGIISANNDFEDESWTLKKEHIIDLHLRALDKIWEEGLYLINKDKY
ncbi:MAG: hypothetical protein ABSF81_10515 [Bacteroidales bacterium]